MQIIFNGKTYDKPEDMPVNERAAYDQMQKIFVDANGNGIPDFLEGDVAKNVMTAFTSNVHYDGKVYNNLDELPESARKKVQEAFAKLNQMGIVNAGNFTPEKSSLPFEPAFQPSEPLIPMQPMATEANPSRWLIIIAAVAALFICGAAAAVLLFLRSSP